MPIGATLRCSNNEQNAKLCVLPHIIMQICIHSSASSSFASQSQLRKAALESAQHVLQFGELARAIAIGDVGVDCLRRRRDRLDQLQSLGEIDTRRGADRPWRSGARSDRALRDRAGCVTGSAPAETQHAPVPSPRWCPPPSARAGSAIAVRSAHDCARMDGTGASRLRAHAAATSAAIARIRASARARRRLGHGSVRRFLACHRQWSA